MTVPGLEKVFALLGAVFPDERVKLTQELAEGVLRALPSSAQHSLIGEVLAPLAGDAYPPGEVDSRVIDYWQVDATHERMGRYVDGVPKLAHRFVGRVPMVRVDIDDGFDDMSTEIGIVFAGDHLRRSRISCATRMQDGLRTLHSKNLREKPAYAQRCLQASLLESDKVHLITPARYYGARFAAVAVEIHLASDGKPFAYRLEAGMATGEAMVDFVSPVGDAIELRNAWYEPTPFSSVGQKYSGNLVLDGIDPMVMQILKFTSSLTRADVKVTSSFTRVAKPEACWPSVLTAQAALRVAAIASAMGKEVPGLGPLTHVLAEIGRNTLEWEIKP